MGSKTKSSESTSLADAIIVSIREGENGKTMELKSLRKAALLATKHLADKDGDVDKPMKKLFKGAIQALENDGRVTLSSAGIVKLSKSERSNSSGKQEQSAKKKSKDKKKKRTADDHDIDDEKKTKKAKSKKEPKDDGASAEPENEEETDGNAGIDNTDNQSDDVEEGSLNKNKPCKGNPQGITRLFLGNLPFAITDSTLNDHLNSTITHIKWITDKETGRFYGSAFCEVKTSRDAAKAVAEINGTKVMGRPIKINYAPIKPGQEGDWPPKQKVITGGKVANNAGQAGGQGIKAMSVKPEGCCKLFIGNLSYELDDDGITKFFMAVDAEIKAIRWLHHKDSGDFKGCGYVDFWTTDACEKAASLNGKNLLGRPIRIDWAE